MAIDTDNKKLGVIEWDAVFEPGLPLSPGTLGQDDQQQLIHGYPGILWTEPSETVDNSKLAHMEWCSVWEPGLPVSPDTLGQDDQQQLLWSHPDVLWGEAEVVEVEAEETPGGGFWFDYDREISRRRAREAELARLEAEAKRIQDRLTREIALELRKKEAEQERLDDIKRLVALAEKHRQSEVISQNDRVLNAVERAVSKGNYSALQAFDREIRRAKEEEEFLMQASLMLLH